MIFPDRYRSVKRFQNFLRRNELTFACAESCTGGLLAREMTALAGSSEVFWGGAVTYSNEAKTALLGVPAALIASDGAVSAAVALAMAEGLVRVSGVPLAAAITGIAGPGGGSAEKPVGTVWFGLAARRGALGLAAVRFRFSGGRGAVQKAAARWARVLAAQWWESDMDLDSLRQLTDNEENLFEPAPSAAPFSPPPLKPFPPKP